MKKRTFIAALFAPLLAPFAKAAKPDPAPFDAVIWFCPIHDSKSKESWDTVTTTSSTQWRFVDLDCDGCDLDLIESRKNEPTTPAEIVFQNLAIKP
jgi:hypothetical protein